MRNKEVVESLRSIPLFSRVGEEDLETITSRMIERRFPKNTTVARRS